MAYGKHIDSDRPAQMVGLERLGLELVQERIELALCSFDDGAAVLPDRVLGGVTAVDRIALVLMAYSIGRCNTLKAA